jgi:hypothetical protein
MLGSTRIIDLTVNELNELITTTTQKVISTELANFKNAELQNRSFSINELAQKNIVGKYHRIKSLIESGELTQLSDGKISGLSVYNFLNNKG